jgi:hypothetical protein
VLDWRNCADVTIIIAAAVVTAIVSDIIITGGAIIAIGSVVGVPTVISIVIFVRRPRAQETPYRRVLLSQLVVILLFRGVVPFLGHVFIIIFILQFPIEEELKVLTMGQGLIVL